MYQMGYKTNRILLLLVNFMYLFIAISLILIAAQAYFSPNLTSLDLFIGLIFLGFILLLLAILGIYAAKTSSQIALFFYSLLKEGG